MAEKKQNAAANNARPRAATRSHSKPRSVQPRTGAQLESMHDRMVAQLSTIESLYRSLDSMRDRQRELIDAEDPESLFEVLAKRERVVHELQHADGLFQPLNDEWESASASGTLQERDDVQARIDSIAHLASKVASDDNDDNERMVRRRTVIATQLAGLSISRAATTAYGEPNKESPRFQDREV